MVYIHQRKIVKSSRVVWKFTTTTFKLTRVKFTQHLNRKMVVIILEFDKIKDKIDR